MIKILIDNEEVVSNNNLQIKEEMLSTSSTILKNCYPKSWEDDKDYVSRYYFPKDYSKCKITDDVYHPEVIGTRVSGTNFTINYDNTLNWNLEELKGNTLQDGTPTPSSPVPIQSITGLQNINVCGKNLLDIATIYGNQQSYNLNIGVDLRVQQKNTNGSYSVSGNDLLFTINASWEYAIVYLIPVNTNTNYYLSCDTRQTNLRTSFYELDKDYKILTKKVEQGGLPTGSITTGANTKYLALSISANTTGTLTISNIQLEIGSTATEYEPYKGNTYEVNLGKNLLNKNTTDINNITSTITPISTGIRATITQAGTYKYGYIKLGGSELLGKRITITTNITNSASNKGGYYLCQLDSNNNSNSSYVLGARQSTSGSYTFTLPSNFTDNSRVAFGFYIYGNIDGTGNVNDYTDLSNFQIELGSQPTSYSPYFTPIELNKIGTYQDKIYKDNGKWYIEKQTGTINSYNGEAITTSYISTTGQLTTGAKVIYVLNTPTTEEITNTELINQLESIRLLKGTNNITITSENLPMIMQLYYNYKEAYTSEDLLFCGCVKNTGKISLNPREPHYVDLQVLDFKTLLSEGETLNYVITNKTIVEAINQVVSSISDYGFIVGNINILNPNDIINAYSTLNKTAYDVFQYIADITQSKWTTRMIDENTIAIDFYDPTLMPQANPIQSTEEYYEENKIVDISFNYNTNDYRNKQIMTSDEVYANITQTETKIADGYTKTFMCDNKIGQITNIKVNGIEASFCTKSQQQLGVSADFVYQPGEMTFISSNTISAGSLIIITYYPIVKGREIVLDYDESSRISTQIGRKGTISRYENRNDTTSSQELQKIGQSYIKYKGQAEITLKVVSEMDLFNIGQIVEYEAPLEELSTEYLVKKKTIDWYLSPNKLFYTYELSSNFNSENAINYFDNQRAKNQGNIGEGETITRNIDLENRALIIFYDTEIEEVQVENPTSLDFALDGVLI